MASRKILVQLDIAAASNLTSPSSGFVGFSAKADGLYQKIGTAPELRLLTSADVQNAILADGSITGAVSQAQIFTLGVKLYNLTQGYVPYASGSTKILGNSPIYTDGTSVGIGTNNPFNKLQIMGNVGIQTSYSNGLLNFMGNSTTTLISTTRSDNTMIGNLAFDGWGSYMFSSRLGVGTNISLSNSTATLYVNGNVGIGTPAPNQQLEITQNFRLPSTTGTTPYGIIYKGTAPFIHDFNYGNNGTVTTAGQNTFVGINAGNFTMGSTAIYSYEASYNTVIGFQSFFFNTTGNSNTTSGSYSLYSNTTGSTNIAIGYAPLFSNTTGSSNVATGSYSLYSNTIGNLNTANGYESLFSNTTGSSNVATGSYSLYSNTTGHSNTANGYAPLYSNTTGYNNTAYGHASLNSNTTGNNNTALGFDSGRFIANGTNGRSTGDNGLYLGYNSKASADGTDNEIVIGYNAIGKGSNTAAYGNSSMAKHIFEAGNVGIGTMYPTASLHIKEGTAIAGTAPLKLTSGVNLTTPEVGSIEFSSSRLYFTPSSTRETVAFLSDITTASHAPITLGEIGSAPNSNGITLIGQVLNLEPASALYGGVLTNSAQTIAGAKTLSSLLTASTGIANNGSYTQTGTSANTFTGNSTFAGLTITGTILGDTDSARNLMANNVYTYGLAGYQYTNGRILVSGSLNRMGLSRESNFETNRAKTLTHGYYSVSFWYKVESYTSGTAMFPNLNDVSLATLDVSGNKAWTFYSSTVYMTTTSYGFLDIEGTFGSTVTISDIMIVRSAKTPQQYVLAPEDIIQYNSIGNVGIGTPNPLQKLDVSGNITTFGKSPATFFPNGAFIAYNSTGDGTYGSGMSILAKETSFGGFTIGYETTSPNKWLLGISNGMGDRTGLSFFEDSVSAKPRLTIATGGNVGIGTPAPNQQLEITQNFRLPSTAGTNPYGIIYKDATPFIHDFNYGNNGTVTTDGRNTFVGINAGNLTMGSTATSAHHASYNTGIGYQSLFSNTTGYSNTANGYQSLYSNTTGSQNTANGYQSLYSNTTGSNNTANGFASLNSNTIGNANTANGFASLYSNTTGSNNTANGFASLNSNTTGSNNTANGFASLNSNTIGNANTANGFASLFFNTTGNDNTANGFDSLYSNTTGSNNTANGFDSLNSNTIGSNNTAFGANSGCYIANGTTGRSTGDNGLYLGCNSKASADGTNNEIVIGYNAIGAGSNKTVIGNSSVTDTYFGSSTGSSKLWASALNLSSLTASKLVFTDSSKNLTSIGIGTASQFIKGDGSLDSNTYLTTGTAIISGSGVDGRVTFWDGTNSLSSTSSLWWNDTTKNLGVTGGIVANSVSASISVSTNSLLTNSFSLIATTTAGYVLTTDANGNGTWQAPQGGGNIVSSVFGRTGTVVAVNGDYNTSQVTENTNLYFTDSRARVAISLTINGQSGASTYNNSTGILNVPNYSLTGLGGVPKTRTITINGEVQDLSANRTWNVGDLLSTGSYSNPSWLTSLAWSKITNKPTTFYGYGITETPWTSYLPLSGGTLTGDLNSKRIICQSIIGDDYNTGAIEIWGSYDNTFYPTLGFHQPSNFAASIQLRGAIDFRLYAQGGTTYANLTTNKLISASLQIGTSTTSGYVLTADANGNGTWQAPTGGGSYTLPTASASVLGCVKIGSGITISSGVISVSTNYEAPLTFSSGLTRSGNAISVTSGTYVPFVGADRDVNLASYSIYAYDFLVYSDINLKCNIEDIKMKKLDINYKQFEYKTSRGEKRYGVIAQELLSIAPEFVSESNNSYAVKYTDLLIYEVAQLKEEVKQLKSLLCR